MMKEIFIPFELAIELKKLGFNEPCFGAWERGNFLLRYKTKNHKFQMNVKMSMRGRLDYCAAPTFDQVFNWLRERHGIHGSVNLDVQGKWFAQWEYIDVKNNSIEGNVFKEEFETTRETAIFCIEEILKIIKDKGLIKAN